MPHVHMDVTSFLTGALMVCFMFVALCVCMIADRVASLEESVRIIDECLLSLKEKLRERRRYRKRR